MENAKFYEISLSVQVTAIVNMNSEMLRVHFRGLLKNMACQELRMKEEGAGLCATDIFRRQLVMTSVGCAGYFSMLLYVASIPWSHR